MLLEIITGQRAFDLARFARDEDIMLLEWVGIIIMFRVKHYFASCFLEKVQ